MGLIVIIIGLIGLILGCLIGAMILRAGAQWVLKEDVPFGQAFGTVVIFTFTNFVIGFIIGLVIGSASRSPDAVFISSIISWPVGFLIQSGVISLRLSVGFGKACLVSLAMLGIVAGIALVVVPIIYFANS